MDPAIRSIRIATTLTERFGELIRSAPGIRLDGGSHSEAELSARIGEAQQIHPEI